LKVVATGLECGEVDRWKRKEEEVALAGDGESSCGDVR
jgi:hypothetical protein